MKSQKSKVAIIGLIFRVMATIGTITVLALAIEGMTRQDFETGHSFYLLIFSGFGSLFYVIPFIISCVPYFAKDLSRGHSIYMMGTGTLCTIIFIIGVVISTLDVINRCNVGFYSEFWGETLKFPNVYCNLLRATTGMVYITSIGYFVAVVIDAYIYISSKSKSNSLEMDTLDSDDAQI